MVVQWADLIISKTRRNSIFQQGMGYVRVFLMAWQTLDTFVYLFNLIIVFFKELGAEFRIGFRDIIGHLFYIHSMA